MENDSRKKKVVRYSGSKAKQEIKYGDKEQHLYSSHDNKYINENRNLQLNVCVSDRGAGAVVVVNQAGKLRFTYTGPPFPTNETFKPVGITSDNQGQILTAANNHIHIIDQDGQFVCYTVNRSLQNPWGLCVDTRDNLLVTEYNTGTVKKIQYYIDKNLCDSASS